MKSLLLRDGINSVLLDDADFGSLSQWSWHLDKEGYVRRQFRQDGKKKVVYLHQEIMGRFPGKQVHHKNENKLDCQRANMELLDILGHHRKHSARLVDWCMKHRWHQTKNCTVCGKEFQPNPKRIQRHKTCSPECASTARSAANARRCSETQSERSVA